MSLLHLLLCCLPFGWLPFLLLGLDLRFVRGVRVGGGGVLIVILFGGVLWGSLIQQETFWGVLWNVGGQCTGTAL